MFQKNIKKVPSKPPTVVLYSLLADLVRGLEIFSNEDLQLLSTKITYVCKHFDIWFPYKKIRVLVSS